MMESLGVRHLAEAIRLGVMAKAERRAQPHN